MSKLALLLVAVLSLTVGCSNDPATPANNFGGGNGGGAGGGIKSAADQNGNCTQEVMSDFESYNQRLQSVLPELQNFMLSNSNPTASDLQQIKPALDEVTSVCDEATSTWGVFVCREPGGSQVNSQELVDQCRTLKNNMSQI